jgi:hypothetical protein
VDERDVAGTALEALTRAYLSLGGSPDVGAPDYLAVAHSALKVFTIRPPAGVGAATPIGMRYVQYSFAGARNQEVINAFLQALIGLHDYADASQDTTAQTLFDQGDAEAQAELPQFDTGAWSLYEPGEEDTLDYHELVLGFLEQLCTMTSAPSYCTTAENFQGYLQTPPLLSLTTTELRVRKPAAVHFTLSKASHVGIVVLRGTQTLLATSASFSYGAHSFAMPTPKRRGELTVRMSATDRAGNFTRITGAISLTS